MNAGTGCSKDVAIDSTVIPSNVESAKVLPICLYPIKKNGIFRKNINTPSFQPDKCERIIEIPTIPRQSHYSELKRFLNQQP